MRIPRRPYSSFRKFVRPFQPPATHKIDDWGRVVPLGVPIPKMPGEAPRPVLAAPSEPASQPPLEAAGLPVDPADRDMLLELNAKLLRAAPDEPPLLNAEQAHLLETTRETPAAGPVARSAAAARESAVRRPAGSTSGAERRQTRRETQRQQPRRKRRTARRRAKANAARVSPDHHERHCSICKHPEREEIEAEFVEWFYPGQIAHSYDVERRALYRHAHATGLYAQRDRNLRFALTPLIEGCHGAQVSGDTVVRAVRAYTRRNSEGQWIEPPTRVTVSPGGGFLSSQSLTQVVPVLGPGIGPAVESLPVEADE